MERLEKDSLYFIFLEVLRLHYNRTHTMLDKIGVYPGQPPLLFLLNKNDGLSQKDIADRLGIKASTITVMLRRMESGGLIYRQQDEIDQRIIRVFLTNEGRLLCKKVIEVTMLFQNNCFGNFSDEEKEIFKAMLTKMRNNLRKDGK